LCSNSSCPNEVIPGGHRDSGPPPFAQYHQILNGLPTRLKLSPEQYASSPQLRKWVEKNWRQKFVPGLISETEVAAERPALSALVVIKSGDGANHPGTGFFELEKSLGRYKSDDDTTWLLEIDGLFKYWPKH
jgi:hypothetical protein